MRLSKGLLQAYAVQDLTFQALQAWKEAHSSSEGKLIVSDKDEAAALGQLVKSWEIGQERVRIHRNKPLPGSLKPEPKTRKKSESKLTIADFPAAQSEVESSPDQSLNG